MKVNELQSERRLFHQSGAISDSRIPLLIWITIDFAVSMFMLLSEDNDYWIRIFFFTGLFVLHASLYWHSPAMVVKRAWLYFIMQASIIYTASVLVPESAPAVLIGLFPVLIGQCVGVYDQKKKLIAVMLGCYGLVWCSVFVTGWIESAVVLIPLFVLMNVVVVSYGVLFFRQVHARLRTQSFFEELERTHRKVEELTLANERQRMARDLHDTLAQGLAGLLMQLEAADAYLDKANPARAQEIVNKAMERARTTLSEARMAIDDLRLNGGADSHFADLVRNTVDKLTAGTPVAVTLHAPEDLSLSGYVMEHCLHVIGECIANTVKHANASSMQITIEQEISSGSLLLRIQDNGIGFNTETIGRLAGHYGLVGIKERVRLLGGMLDIHSEPEAGTTIEIKVPGKEGVIT
ncbi:sensor histidine kinase [Paenibacillus nanensis]|uniref:histidine kinase n=1 Tax=Paenibacillus nanensis TaxID=393251 RepID=A0A3A1UV68_9BACL|nr:sensor histidine kinase [Paenibacillus nanensis]RIX52438.1 sensor histidine kinase [Paenibacillus nanensis]